MKNEYQVTKKLFRSWVTENMYKGMQLYINIGWAAFGILAVVLLIFSADSTLDYVLFGVMLVLGVYNAFLRIFLVSAVQYRRTAQVYGTENWTRTITFGDEKIYLTEGNASADFEYGDIIRIKEKDNNIWLTMKNRIVVRLYKDAFVDCGWEDCRAFIDEKR